MPLGDALVLIKDMLHALSSPDSPGFSRHAVNPTIKLLSAQRMNKNGKEASDEEVAARKFLGKTVFRMQCKPEMANQLGSMHGGCVATVVDNLTSVAVSGRAHAHSSKRVTLSADSLSSSPLSPTQVYLHLSDLEPTTPWAFLGVTQSLSVVYLAAAPVGHWVDIECNVISIGSRIVVVTCDMYLLESEEGGRIKKTASGTHTKVDNSFATRL